MCRHKVMKKSPQANLPDVPVVQFRLDGSIWVVSASLRTTLECRFVKHANTQCLEDLCCAGNWHPPFAHPFLETWHRDSVPRSIDRLSRKVSLLGSADVEKMCPKPELKLDPGFP